MITIVQSWTAECDFSEIPGRGFIGGEANRTMCEKADLIQPNKVKSQAPNERRDINIFSLTTSNRLTEKQPVGGAWCRSGWVFFLQPV